MDALTQAQHKAAATLYQQAAPGGGQGTAGGGPQGGQGSQAGGPTGSGGPASGDVIDAEVVDDK
jgi:hypothetical protein